jgi:tetratricopeptide (TPR) repeat protein
MRVILAAFVLSMACCAVAQSQSSSNYESFLSQGQVQLQAGNTELALRSAEAAIHMSAQRWEGYALSGGALMNLKRYEDAADRLSKAIERAPQDKQTTLRSLRRQCLVAEAGMPAMSEAPRPSREATTTQAEIVLWKSIESSTNAADFRSYLDQYPAGAFAVLARRHLTEQAYKEDPNRAASDLAIERQRDRLRGAGGEEEQTGPRIRRQETPESNEERKRRLAEEEQRLQGLQGLTPAQRRELNQQN